MRNFQELATGVRVLPLLLAIQQQPVLWNQHRLRTTFPGSPHAQVDDIWIRFNDITQAEQTGDATYIMDQHESIWYPASAALPEARPLLFGLMGLVEGERLGRVIITRLAPGKRITPHRDSGDHATYYERYHISLQCPPQALFRAGEEIVHMAPGSIWWFNNQAEHEVWNDDQADRLTMIVDIKQGRTA